ncbi:MAG: alpha/beta hydrolase-fold protein [Oscillospiraceae bacterium]
MALVNLNFESKYLRCNNDVTVILPDKPRGADPKDFYTSGNKYKVLWLLHGTFGDHTDWYRHTNIELYACEKEVIVVMPSAINTNYQNWPYFGTGYYFFDYVTEELMPLIQNWFPASGKREDNFIAGLSMGSRGAFRFVTKCPEKFAGAAMLSASPHDYDSDSDYLNSIMTKNRQDLKAMSTNYKGPFDQAFRDMRMLNEIDNNGGSVCAYLEGENMWREAKKLAHNKNCPKLLFAIGTEDPLFSEYQHFKEYAEEIGLKAVFMEEKGYKHEWRFWDKYIEKALEFFGMHGETGGKEFVEKQN